MAFCRYFPGRSLRIVVTGINGFLGSHVGRELRSQGHYVVGADWVRHRDHAIPLEESCDEFYLCDLRTYDAWHCLLTWPLDRNERVHLFHCARDRGGGCHATLNTTLVDMHMVEACRATGVDRAVYVSYADDVQLHVQLHTMLAEHVCGQYSRQYAVDVRVARVGAVYGPQGPWACQEHVATAMCRKVAAAARQGDALEMHLASSDVVECLYIDDAVESVLRVMMCDATPGGVVVTVDGTRATVAHLADLAMDVAGKHLTLVCPAPDVQPPPATPTKTNTFTGTRTTPAARALRWEPTTPLHRGMAVLYSWVSDQVAAQHPDQHAALRLTRDVRPTTTTMPLGTYARHGRPAVPPAIVVSRKDLECVAQTTPKLLEANDQSSQDFDPHASIRALQASLRPIVTKKFTAGETPTTTTPLRRRPTPSTP